MNLTSLLKELEERGIRLLLEGEQLRVQAPKGAVTAVLRDLIVEKKSELLAELRSHRRNSAHVLPDVVPRPDLLHQPFPLTDIQHAYWVGRSGAIELGAVSTHGYMEFAYRDLNVERLTAALNRLIARHEMLRAIVLPTGEQQILADAELYTIPTLDLSTASEEEQAKHIADIRQELSHQVLPVDRSPMVDIRVSRLRNSCLLLHLSIDIMMFDLGSLYIFFDEWQSFYENPTVALPPIDLSFRDYVLAEAGLKSTVVYEKARDYWLNRINTIPSGPELPLRQDRLSVTEQIFQRRTHTLDRTDWQSLKAKAQKAGISSSILLLTAFASILAVWCKRPRFTLNLTLFNRLPLHPNVNQLIGDFTSLTLVEVDYTKPISLAEQSQRLQRQLWESLEHRYFGGVEVMRAIAQNEGIPAAGLMPVVFTSAVGLDTKERNSILKPFDGELRFGLSQTPQVWLDHQIFEQEGELLFNWDTVDDIFLPAVLNDMFDAYCGLLRHLLTDETAWHAPHLTLLPQYQIEERGAINSTATAISDELLHTLFLQQVASRATEPAIITPTKTLSYQDLYDRANQVGHWLRDHGAEPNKLVAVVIERGWEQVVAILGIHLSGAAYLPIDPKLPTERRNFLLAASEATLILTQSRLETELTWPEGMTRLAVDTLTPNPALPPLEIVQSSTDLAYVIYTSGSTGRPKGVVIDHRGAVNTVLDVNQRYGVTANDRVLALSALNFDLSVYDIFGPLAAGGGIVIPAADRRIDPAHWVELIQQHKVTIWNTVPALMQMLVEYEEGQSNREANGLVASEITDNDLQLSNSATLRLVMLSGDWIPVTLPDRIKALWDGIKVYSMGGATEASIWSIDYPIEAVDPTWTSIPYGKPMTNQTFHVLDANLNPRPTWVSGDLYIGGIGVALGYWNDEERTDASFITHPRTAERLYKTGDLGRYLPDGNIEFLGREDFQVKIRGHRIELGEIENTLLQHPGISEAVVNAVGDHGGDPGDHRQLVGYVVLDEKWRENQASAEQLPDIYDNALAVALADPIDRLEFKVRQPGVRRLPDAAPVSLSAKKSDELPRNRWLARQSYRLFGDEAISADLFSDFLRCLMQMPLENMPLPKYRYPSAGSLYPVQCYLYLKPERIAGLAGGYYYYHPIQHQLIPLPAIDELGHDVFGGLGVNQAIFDGAAFTLLLVSDLDAITPMYGNLARDYSLLEAGYMSQLLMMEAPQYELGLCPIGGIDTARLQLPLALGENHQLLHTLAGGSIDPIQQTQWLQNLPTVGAETDAMLEANSWQQQLQHYLAQRLPDYMVPDIYLQLTSLPLTANGKVDRKALPEPDAALFQTTEFVAPRNETEQTIADIWSDLLHVNPVGVHDDFFAIGGDSLLATQLQTQLRDKLQIDLPLRALFEFNTIARMVEEIQMYQLASEIQLNDSTIENLPVEPDETEEAAW